MQRTVYAISLRPDEAFFVAKGLIKTILLDEDYSDDMYLLAIHACKYADPLDRKDAENNLRKAGFAPNVVQENTLIGFAAPDVVEYDNNSFKLDAENHRSGTNLDIFKAQNDWDDAPVYGYQMAGVSFCERPIVGVTPIGEDRVHGEVWEADTPFEELCLEMCIADAKMVEEEEEPAEV